MHIRLVTELHASLMTSRAITIGTYPAESCDYCGGLEMAPHENKWSPLDGAHE